MATKDTPLADRRYDWVCDNGYDDQAQWDETFAEVIEVFDHLGDKVKRLAVGEEYDGVELQITRRR